MDFLPDSLYTEIPWLVPNQISPPGHFGDCVYLVVCQAILNGETYKTCSLINLQTLISRPDE